MKHGLIPMQHQKDYGLIMTAQENGDVPAGKVNTSLYFMPAAAKDGFQDEHQYSDLKPNQRIIMMK